MIRDPFLETQGIHNFRDYGGWRTQDGGQVRTGLLYRSGHHVEATDEDLAAIAPLGIHTVIDLRGESERSANPCRRVEGFDGEVVFYEGETTSSPPHMDIDPEMTASDFARERMLAVYTRMPDNPAMIEMFHRYLTIIAEREGASLVHCYAGKDRTGVAATMLLHILGVSEDDQRREFLRTNESPTFDILARQSLPGIEARLGRKLDEGAAKDLLGVREEYLDRYLEIARARHGSFDGYLAQAIGVDDALRARLRAKFVA
ncbi:tyrosine-protein phosphatase [Qipengyuania sp. YG27]|uniref:Tyrosine-protein phosphatase n=1 Tax=Qipengyuania mesophila TaxID=2867246 RepID=A0ABS7JRH7_9SPHN|nr:tyrosine-protein phosphatase [Qipengyuania mesophila]MBX7500219.1 tyrosine-protein phosphatase [Qipengyuania mesophila]